jgi:hypothetical protein
MYLYHMYAYEYITYNKPTIIVTHPIAPASLASSHPIKSALKHGKSTEALQGRGISNNLNIQLPSASQTTLPQEA